jgi:glutathione S-transferase
MSLTLYFHPFASFCQKALIALYENDTPFSGRVIDLSNEAERAELTRLWPFAKFPVLRDEARNEVVPEATIIIEYLAQHHPGRSVLLPADTDRARETRLWDRFYDLYVNEPMGKIVTDRLRPAGRHDPQGVAQARGTLETASGMIEKQMETRPWATGDAFGMADCAAAPALWYANLVQPFGDRFPRTSAYLARLVERPSFARVLEEARPYFPLFPRDPDA